MGHQVYERQHVPGKGIGVAGKREQPLPLRPGRTQERRFKDFQIRSYKAIVKLPVSPPV